MSATLAVDLGGTKLLCALVDGACVLAQTQLATDRDAGPETWLNDAAAAARAWRGRFDRAGLAVTGRVADGLWSALNVGTLAVPPGTPLCAMAAARFGVPAMAANDAQAAAWGEHLHGAGRGRDLVYLTISTGIGGGIVAGGRLLRGRGGIAGHAGQMRGLGRGALLEDRASGRWLAAAAREAGHAADARGVFAAAEAGAAWARPLIDTAAARAANLGADLQVLLDPAVIVVGGGVGRAPGFLERMRTHLAGLPAHLRPDLARSELGERAGVVGIAALARVEAADAAPCDTRTDPQQEAPS